MPSAISVKIEGLDGFKRAIGKSPKIALAHLQTAIKKSLVEIQHESVPVTPIDTGRLRGSYRMALSSLQGLLNVDTNYALFVHEGTKFMKARPFLRWGIQAATSAVQQHFKTELAATLDDIAREAKR